MAAQVRWVRSATTELDMLVRMAPTTTSSSLIGTATTSCWR